RKAFAEHYLQVSGESIGGIGIPPRDRLAQYENPVRARGLFCGDDVRPRCPEHTRREKGRGKKLIVAISRAALICAGMNDSGWRSNSADAQHHLRDREQ